MRTSLINMYQRQGIIYLQILARNGAIYILQHASRTFGGAEDKSKSFGATRATAFNYSRVDREARRDNTPDRVECIFTVLLLALPHGSPFFRCHFICERESERERAREEIDILMKIQESRAKWPEISRERAGRNSESVAIKLVAVARE